MIDHVAAERYIQTELPTELTLKLRQLEHVQEMCNIIDGELGRAVEETAGGLATTPIVGIVILVGHIARQRTLVIASCGT